jgi:hypothetical protein
MRKMKEIETLVSELKRVNRLLSDIKPMLQQIVDQPKRDSLRLLAAGKKWAADIETIATGRRHTIDWDYFYNTGGEVRYLEDIDPVAARSRIRVVSDDDDDKRDEC